ncbi:hypothetical protein IAU60_000481 [Kwoniella sp. DSM 27419]
MSTMPSAKEIASSSSFVSPLTRLEVEGRSARSRANSAATPTIASFAPAAQHTPAPPVPALELNNLFRSSSRYSVDSLSSHFSSDSHGSYDTVETQSGTQHTSDADEDGMSTPKASTAAEGYSNFERKGDAPPTPSRATQSYVYPSLVAKGDEVVVDIPSRGTTPKRGFTVKSRPPPAQPISLPQSAGPSRPNRPDIYAQPRAHTPAGPQPTQRRAPFQLGDIPPRTRQRSHSDARAGEAPVPQRPEEEQVADDWASVHGEQGSDWGDDESQFEWVDTQGAPAAVNGDGREGKVILIPSPTKGLSRLRSVIQKPGTSTSGEDKRKSRKPLVIHRRAPPPPPNTAPAPPPPEAVSPRRTAPPEPIPVANLPGRSRSLRAASSGRPRPPLANRSATGGSASSGSLRRSPRQDVFFPPEAPFARKNKGAPAPLMMPPKDDEATSAPMIRPDTRTSHMSSQSVAYSFYDLDGNPSPTTPRAEGELAFPNGRYVKVSASTLGREPSLARTESQPSVTTDADRSAEDFVHAGIEARGKGDMAKSAWYFMRAAQGGSATGRMYWGLALRHGWGVARDDKRAFTELRQACDDSLAEGAVDFHQSPGASKLTKQQKKSVTDELALGIFEVGNCFLEGAGVKKAPEVAVAYLRRAAEMGDIASQEQLGFLLSKGSNGVKKDMKEAAKWYRMAINGGSSNTFGLAWVWKDKYMD